MDPNCIDIGPHSPSASYSCSSTKLDFAPLILILLQLLLLPLLPLLVLIIMCCAFASCSSWLSFSLCLSSYCTLRIFIQLERSAGLPVWHCHIKKLTKVRFVCAMFYGISHLHSNINSFVVVLSLILGLYLVTEESKLRD